MVNNSTIYQNQRSLSGPLLCLSSYSQKIISPLSRVMQAGFSAVGSLCSRLRDRPVITACPFSKDERGKRKDDNNSPGYVDAALLLAPSPG